VIALNQEEVVKSRIWLALLTLYIAWGTTYLAIRFAVETIPPFFMTGTRFIVAGLVLYVWRRLAGDPAPTRFQWRSAVIIGGFLLVGGIGGVTLAERYIPSGIAALVVAATPMWIVIIEALRPGGSRLTWQSIAGVLIGMAGIIFLVDPGSSSAHQPGYSLFGIVIVLLAALSWSVGSIYSHEVKLPDSPLLGTGMELLAGAAGSYLIGLLMGESRQLDLSAISLRSLSGLGYLIVVGSLIGFVCYTWLLRVAPTPLVVTYAYVNPLVAVLLGSLIAAEALTPRVLIASPLILTAVALIQVRQQKKVPAHTPGIAVHASAGED
jgi:drug/metabolite transporter (DMT)-like permease